MNAADRTIAAIALFCIAVGLMVLSLIGTAAIALSVYLWRWIL